VTTLHRTFRYKLEPTNEQAATFERFASVVRFVYNLALEHRELAWTYYRDNGVRLNAFQQGKELSELRADVAWIAAVPHACEEHALQDLERAYINFFAGRARRPTWRVKGINESFRFRGRDVPVKSLSTKWAAAKLPKIGWVKFRDTRPTAGKVKTVTISRSPLGWHIAFACEIEAPNRLTNLPAVGIDRGVANTLALSTGEMFSVPAALQAADHKIRWAQRVVARRTRGSGRHRIAKARVAALSARRARMRADWQHKATTAIAERFGIAVLEDLQIRNMTARGRRKHGLNRRILDQGWGAIATMLDYKLAERGGTLVTVPAAYSSQTCSSCGTVDKASRKNQATFACAHCGFEGHADHNAAIVILRRNTAWQDVEGSRWRPDEASTVDLAAA
jgi:putative transposase